MKYTNSTQTLWDEQFTLDGKTYSVDALLDSRWAKRGSRATQDLDISLEDFELVNIDISVRNDSGEFQSLGTFTNLSSVDASLRPHLIALCMLKLQDVKLDSWEDA